MLVRCELCPRECVISPGQSGDCRIRVNINGKLCAVTYGFPCSVHVDPVEKKPVYHFLPGTETLSLATVGCNLHCKNCQNWEISQQDPERSSAHAVPPDVIPKLAKEQACLSVSYTYTDPVAYYEYTLDSCRLARDAGLKNILVTAGYINEPPWRELLRVVDSARIDLKSMSDQFYQDICGGKVAPVLRALEVAREMGVEVEIVHLIIPGLNDRDEDLTALCRWIKGNLGAEIPLHFSRFFPQHKLQHIPPTPQATLERARKIAGSAGLNFVYVGNIVQNIGSDTECPQCGQMLIRRRGYSVLEQNLRNGKCPKCNTPIYGIWS